MVQPCVHGLQSSLQLAVQSGNAPAGEPCAHVASPMSLPSHSSPGSMLPLPQVFVVVVVEFVVVVVVVVVVVFAVSSLNWSLMKESTADSSAFVCPVCVHPPAFSAFVTAVPNLISAFERHVGSTPVPFATAFAWHLSLLAAFFPAAAIFFESHGLGPGPSLLTMLRTLSTNVSTLASMAPSSPFGARHAPFVSALENAVENLSDALLRQFGSTAAPFATAFE